MSYSSEARNPVEGSGLNVIGFVWLRSPLPDACSTRARPCQSIPPMMYTRACSFCFCLL